MLHIEDLSCYLGYNPYLGSKNLISTLQTCLIVRVVNHVSGPKRDFPLYRFEFLFVFLDLKSSADSGILTGLRTLREEHASKSISEAAESKEEEDRLALKKWRGRRCCCQQAAV